MKQHSKYWGRGGLGVALCLLLAVALQVRAGNDEPHAGQLLLEGDAGAAVHLGTALSLKVQGLMAEVTVTQQFRNDSDAWVNAVYVYPLAEDSAVTRLSMRIGDRLIIGEIQEKARARAQYEKARTEGKKATLIEQQRPNLFRQQLANIAPGETIEINIGYSQQVHYEAGSFRLKLPMTLTPRYIPGVSKAELLPQLHLAETATGWMLPTDQVTDAPLITPYQRRPVAGELLNPVSLDLALTPGMALATVDSATHAIDVRKTDTAEGTRYRVSFAAGQVSMDRDFELVWVPETGTDPVAALFKTHWQNDDYVQLLLMPPREQSEVQALPRELILVLDTSGSMAGTSIGQARASALMALDTLTPADRFNLVFFNHQTTALFDDAMPVDETTLTMARSYLKGMRADGGTEMMPALERAFKHPTSGTHLQQIVFITDGSVGNESALLTLIHRKLGQARLFTVAIGSAPNRFFMRRAAEFGRGSFTEIATADQVQGRMSELMQKLQKPVVANLAIDWPQPVEMFPRSLPDLYWGEPLLVTAKLPPWPLGANPGVRISGASAGKPWVRELSFPATDTASASEGVPVLAQRFGREKIAYLEDEAYRQGQRQGDTDKVREQILPVALKYQLMSRFTSLVAVDQVVSREGEKAAIDRAVVNAMPAGSQMQAPYPQTAAGTLWHLLLGAVALAGLALLRLTRTWARTRVGDGEVLEGGVRHG